jgi:starch phosphorylase
VRAAWPHVHVTAVDSDVSNAHEGDIRTVTADVELGPLGADDVVVQVLHGSVDQEGSFVGAPSIVDLRHTSGATFAGEFAVGEAGPYGVTVRAMPTSPALVTPVDLGVVAWAS